MFITYAVPFLAAIANTAISTPFPVSSNDPGLTFNNPRPRDSTMRKGRVSCVELEPSEPDRRSHRVSATFNDNRSAGTTPGKNRRDILVVEFDTKAATKGPVNLAIVPVVTWKNYLFIEEELWHPHLGVIPCASSETSVAPNQFESVAMGPSKGTCGVLGTVKETRVNTSFAGPQSQPVRLVGGQPIRFIMPRVYTQSAIWTFDRTTKRLTPHWVNSDNSIVALHVFYDSKRNGFGTTGDIGAFQALHYPVSECYLTFNPI